MQSNVLNNKIALITGASRGIGYEIAKALSLGGVKVALLGRHLDTLQGAQDTLGLSTQDCLLVPGDVSNAEAVARVVEQVNNHFGKIDILINNAAVASPFKLFQEYSYEDMSRLIDINVKGPMYMMRAVLPLMVSQGQGDIVNLNSIAGKKIYGYCSTYLASKFALHGLCESLAEEQKQNDIRFINIYPGRVYTKMWEDLEPGEAQNPDEMLQVSDVSNAVLYALQQPRYLKIPDITLLPANCD